MPQPIANTDQLDTALCLSHTLLQGVCWVLYLEWTQSPALCRSQMDVICCLM